MRPATPARIAWSTWTAASTRSIRFRPGGDTRSGVWEGDTLVIDTIGLQRQVLVRCGRHPHTRSCTPSSEWTRLSYGTLINDFTIDDPGTFTKPVQLRFVARIVKPNIDLMEYICAENNQIGIAGGYLNKDTASQIGIAGGPPQNSEKK
jgi:hypothetical protein